MASENRGQSALPPFLIGRTHLARPADLRRPRSPPQLAFNHRQSAPCPIFPAVTDMPPQAKPGKPPHPNRNTIFPALWTMSPARKRSRLAIARLCGSRAKLNPLRLARKVSRAKRLALVAMQQDSNSQSFAPCDRAFRACGGMARAGDKARRLAFKADWVARIR